MLTSLMVMCSCVHPKQDLRAMFSQPSKRPREDAHLTLGGKNVTEGRGNRRQLSLSASRNSLADRVTGITSLPDPMMSKNKYCFWQWIES